MIEIKFSANSIVELRALISDYLGVIPAKEEPKKKKVEKSIEEKSPEVAAPLEESVSSITLEDIRTLVLSGEIPKAKVKGLLGNFGVERITEVPEADYPVFYEQLSALKGE